jgi:hypothetical protein
MDMYFRTWSEGRSLSGGAGKVPGSLQNGLPPGDDIANSLAKLPHKVIAENAAGSLALLRYPEVKGNELKCKGPYGPSALASSPNHALR